MFKFQKNEKIKMMAENAQKQANITGITYNILEDKKVIMTFHPENKSQNTQNHDDFVPQTKEERKAEQRRAFEVLKRCAEGWQEKKLAEKAKKGLVPCTCNPCEKCNGKQWIEKDSKKDIDIII